MSSPALHPLLRYSQHNLLPRHCCAILWDLREIPSAAQSIYTLGPLTDEELSQHATYPPSVRLEIACEIASPVWPVLIENLDGITVRDVLNRIFSALQNRITLADWERFSPKHQRRVNIVFDNRWRVAPSPEAARANGVLWIDCLLQHTWFAGLTPSPETENTCILTLRRPH